MSDVTGVETTQAADMAWVNTKRQQARREAKLTILLANQQIVQEEEANNLYSPKVILQPLCTYCSFFSVDKYGGYEHTEYDTFCSQHVKGFEDLSMVAYYEEPPPPDWPPGAGPILWGECGAFQPKRGWWEALERHMRNFWHGLFEALRDRSTGNLLHSRYRVLDGTYDRRV